MDNPNIIGLNGLRDRSNGTKKGKMHVLTVFIAGCKSIVIDTSFSVYRSMR